jgi:hypothetical protein
VDVSQIGPIRRNQRAEVAGGSPRIYGIAEETNLVSHAEILDLVIPPRVADHLMAALLEHSAFEKYHRILSAELLKKSVGQQDLQTGIPTRSA